MAIVRLGHWKCTQHLNGRTVAAIMAERAGPDQLHTVGRARPRLRRAPELRLIVRRDKYSSYISPFVVAPEKKSAKAQSAERKKGAAPSELKRMMVMSSARVCRHLLIARAVPTARTTTKCPRIGFKMTSTCVTGQRNRCVDSLLIIGAQHTMLEEHMRRLKPNGTDCSIQLTMIKI
jgi:hypothetical protein